LAPAAAAHAGQVKKGCPAGVDADNRYGFTQPSPGKIEVPLPAARRYFVRRFAGDKLNACHRIEPAKPVSESFFA
jgi:hypothetical protein